MNNFYRFSSFVLAATAVVSSCQDYDLGYTAAEIAYKKNFVEAFGQIDPEQDWNLLAQLTKSGTETRAAGNKTTPTGTFTIDVLPESQAALISADKMKDYSKMLPESNRGNDPYDKTNLGRVTQNFSVTTNKVILYPVYYWTDNTDEIGLYYYSDEAGSVSVSINGGGSANIVRVPITSSKPEELEYSYEAEAQWDQFYNSNYVNYLPTDYQNQLVAANIGFKITDGTEYSQYGQKDIPEGKFMKVGKNTLSYDSPAASAGTEFDCVYEVQPKEVMDAMATLYPEKYIVNGNNDYKYCSSTAGTRYVSVFSNSSCAINVDPAINAALSDDPKAVINGNIKPTGFRSKGIVVNLPSTMKIGFYVKHPGGTYEYSEGKLNGYMHWEGHKNEDECFVATYESEETDANGNPIRYLAFEDWVGGYGDYDLNDIVFRVYGFDSIIDNEEITEEGLFVCEDLGAFDFDFNDIVLKASWKRYYKKTYNKDVNGNVTSVTVEQQPSDELTITGMAAGGNNPSNVYFKTATNSEGVLLGEIHGILNGSAPTIINAGDAYGGDGQTFTYEESEFPVAWNKTTYPNGYVSQIFGEGYLYVIASTTNSVPNQSGNNFNHNADHLINSNGYKTNGVPQMMLLPMYYEWCQENKPIETVYPNFKDWVSDATKTGWITNGKIESLTTDRGVTPQMYEKPTTPSGGGNAGDPQDPNTPPVSPTVPTTTTGLSIGTDYESGVNYGSAYYVTVSAGTFDTSKGGTLTIYCSAPNDELFIADTYRNQVIKASGTTSMTTSTITLTADNFTTISNGFYLGTWNTSNFELHSIVYTPAN